MASSLTLLDGDSWRARAALHVSRAGRFTQPFVDRRHRGQKHPVEDFLFTYYTLSPGQMLTWHPGARVILLDAADYVNRKFYRAASEQELLAAGLDLQDARAAAHAQTAAMVDTELFVHKRESALLFTRQILQNTAQKPGFFGCFGMHEWAMAYRSVENDIRHDYLELRLGASGTDRVVEENRIRCSHFDAFRFFMPQAVELNELQPTREQQRFLEQPACLHANMDVYKWAYKLLPLIDSGLLMDAFELAWDVRELDMRAAPYDLLEWGYEPVRVETVQGKQEYVQAQRAFAQRSVDLRNRLLAAVQPHLPQAATLSSQP